VSAPIHFEVGKSYRTRDGSKATITRFGPNQKSWFGTVDGCTWVWLYNGRIIGRSAIHPLDLVAEWVEPDLKFEVGKAYQTRDGKKAVVLNILGQSNYPVVGVIEGEQNRQCWGLDGRWFRLHRAPADLVAEWVEPALKFEVGKAYRTRGGRKVTLTKVYCNVGLTLQGDLTGQAGTGACADFWHADGRYTHVFETHSNDLVAEWVEPTPEPIHFEVGKAYRTRDGRKAVIDDVLESVFNNHPVIGRILATSESIQEERTWTLKGDWSRWLSGDPRDLVAEWVEPTPQLKDLPLEQMRALDIEKTRKELDYTKGLLKQAQERIQVLENESDAFAKQIEDLCGGLSHIAATKRKNK
jgi:hypothetical protein